MKQQIEFPHVVYITDTTIRFSFAEEISPINLRYVMQFDMFLKANYPMYFIETVPSYHTVTVYMRGHKKFPLQELKSMWCEWQGTYDEQQGKILLLPVCYDEEFALDIRRVMAYSKLTYDEVIRLHSEKVYDVFLMGFLPGFPYLGVLNKALQVPRLKVPRKYVAAGAVGIGGEQTGVYPIDSPGGWNIIGKTPFTLFAMNRQPIFLIEPQSRVKFEPVTKQEYQTLLRKGL